MITNKIKVALRQQNKEKYQTKLTRWTGYSFNLMQCTYHVCKLCNDSHYTKNFMFSKPIRHNGYR